VAGAWLDGVTAAGPVTAGDISDRDAVAIKHGSALDHPLNLRMPAG
jgi:hypothetical protein